MNLKHLVSRQTIGSLSRFNARALPFSACSQGNLDAIILPPISFIREPNSRENTSLHNLTRPNHRFTFSRCIHAFREAKVGDSEESEDDDGTMNEFLSRFAWIMRNKLEDAYPNCDKQMVDGMLVFIVEKVAAEMEKDGRQRKLGMVDSSPSQDFSEDLWKTVWEVSNKVLEEMEKERKKEKMKVFLQDEEVKEMCRFAAEVGIRGDMLREFRFKWAREKMEESEFYQGLERLREQALKEEKDDEVDIEKAEPTRVDSVVSEEKPTFSLPRRQGKFKYKIYGLNLSDPKWAEVADKIHMSEEVTWPKEPKPIFGKCKLVTEKILSLKEDDDPSPILAEWVELLQPAKVDWTALLDQLKEQNSRLYFKVAEHVLGEPSFQANIHDFWKLIDAYAREDQPEDVERILKKMKDNGVPLDILIFNTLIHTYSKIGKLDLAKEAFENLRNLGFRPEEKTYNSMIMAYINAGMPKEGESLIREMEARDLKPSLEINMALLRSFARRGDGNGAGRIAVTMDFAGFQLSYEYYALLVEAYGKAGDLDQARSKFDDILKLGYKPDDWCTACMIAAYEKKNILDKALNLLLQLENDGFEPGVHTYTVLIDWLGKMQLIDEVEQLLSKVAQQGEAPPVKIHVSLCDMYSRAGMEKKALQALGAVDAKKDQLESNDFERVIMGLVDGGLVQDAQRMHGLMEAQGFVASEFLKYRLMGAQTSGHRGRTIKW